MGEWGAFTEAVAWVEVAAQSVARRRSTGRRGLAVFDAAGPSPSGDETNRRPKARQRHNACSTGPPCFKAGVWATGVPVTFGPRKVNTSLALKAAGLFAGLPPLYILMSACTSVLVVGDRLTRVVGALGVCRAHR